jgi:hypothetical protein
LHDLHVIDRHHVIHLRHPPLPASISASPCSTPLVIRGVPAYIEPGLRATTRAG